MTEFRINIPAMSPPVVHEYLYNLGKAWTGQGIAVEFGSWLGATAAALGMGLAEVKYDRPFYCYDKWKANIPEVGKARNQGLKISEKQNLLPIFLENVRPYYNDIRAYRGRINRTFKKWEGGPIEIALLDAPKREPVFTYVMRRIVPHFIDGITVLGLLDYYFYKNDSLNAKKWVNKKYQFEAPVLFMNANEGKFELMAHWPGQCECAFFKYIGGSIKYNY